MPPSSAASQTHAPALDLTWSCLVSARSISDAIFLSQELLYNYHLNSGPARCAIKMDLRKAFDTLSWDFILAALKAINIPVQMVQWIGECVTSSYFSININGNSNGFFPTTRGLRQGDPLSPFLVILLTKGLGRSLKARQVAGETNGIGPHEGMDKQTHK